MRDESKGNNVTKSEVQRQATKQGLELLKDLPKWPDLEPAHGVQVRRAKELTDRIAINCLETRTGFRFANQAPRRMTLSIYPWVVTELDIAAEVAGLSSSHMIVASLILAFNTIPVWTAHFEEEILVLERHIKHRLTFLSGDL